MNVHTLPTDPPDLLPLNSNSNISKNSKNLKNLKNLKKAKRKTSRLKKYTHATENAAFRARRLIVLTAMMVPELFMQSTGIHVHSSNIFVRSRLLPALMMMRNRDRRFLARCTWWPFHDLAAIEWGDPHFQTSCCRKIRAML